MKLFSKYIMIFLLVVGVIVGQTVPMPAPIYNFKNVVTIDDSLNVTGVVTFSGGGSMTGTWTNLGSVTTIDINGGTINGITDLAVADGGTGASTLTDGGVLLGSGTGAITAMSVLADGAMIVGDGTTDPVAESGATLRTSIGVGTGNTVEFEKLGIINAHDLGVGLHVKSGDNGGGGVATDADEIVIEGSGDAGITILTPATNDGRIRFGDVASVGIGTIAYDHNTDAMSIEAGGTNMLYVQNSKVGIENTSLESWAAAWSVLQLGGNFSLMSSTTAGAGADSYIFQNAYYDGAFKYQDTDEASFYEQTAGTHVWKVAASGTADANISWTTALTIDNAGDATFGGDVGIGSSPTAGALHIVQGTADKKSIFMNMSDATMNATDIGVQIDFSADDDATGAHYIRFSDAGGTIGSISVASATTVAYNTSSDYRLKENAVPLSNGLERLNQLNPLRFNFIEQPGITMDGFFAHEVGQVVPIAVSGEKDAVDEDGNIIIQQLDQSKLIPLLVAAVQELSAEVDKLKLK